MPKKRYTPEEIVAKLRQVDVLVSQGQNIADAIRQIGVSEVTYYRWRQEYGGLKADQAPRVVAPVSSRSKRSCMSPSGAPVRRSDSTVRRSARYRGAVKTKSGSLPTPSHWPGNTAAMAIARSPGCWSRRAGWSTTSGSSGSGGARG